jgi:hypothetical protein
MSNTNNNKNNLGTINNLIENVFTKSPLPPCTYSLVFEQNASAFQTLMYILVNGAKKLYGEDITPNDISEKQFDELKMYMESLGYQIKYNYTYPDSNNLEISIINIWFEPYIKQMDCSGRNII